MIKMEEESVFEALKDRFCSSEHGCYPMGELTFQHLLHPELF
jgi:hypothetical protein